MTCSTLQSLGSRGFMIYLINIYFSFQNIINTAKQEH